MASSNSQSALRFEVNVFGFKEFVLKAKQDFPKAQTIVQKVNRKQGRLLQEEILANLRSGIAGGRRAQRPQELLVRAVADKRFVRVTNYGFTLGGIELYSPQAGKYAAIQEVGTSMFVGRTLIGMFQDARGGLVAPNRERRIDPRFIQFKRIDPNKAHPQRGFYNDRDDKGHYKKGLYRPSVTIGGQFAKVEHAIKGYHYFEYGTAAFRASGGTDILPLYRKAFEEAGGNFFALWTSVTGGTKGPAASSVSQKLVIPKAGVK